MTLADCNNNKLELSITSNGLEVSSAMNNGISTTHTADDSNQSSSTSFSNNSSSSSLALGPTNESLNNSLLRQTTLTVIDSLNSNSQIAKSDEVVTVVVVSGSHNNNKNNKELANICNSESLLVKESTKNDIELNTKNQCKPQSITQTTTDFDQANKQSVRRHQSCPTEGVGVSSKKVLSKQANKLNLMAPDLRETESANNSVGSVVFKESVVPGLPPIDNCDIYDTNISNHVQPPSRKITLPLMVNGDNNNSNINDDSGIAVEKPTAPPRKDPPPSQPPLFTSPINNNNLPIKTSSAHSSVDWKTKLNNELITYQKHLLLGQNSKHSQPFSLAYTNHAKATKLPPSSITNNNNRSSHVASSDKKLPTTKSPNKQVNTVKSNRLCSPESYLTSSTSKGLPVSTRITTTVGSNGSTDYSWTTDNDSTRLSSPSPIATSPTNEHKWPPSAVQLRNDNRHTSFSDQRRAGPVKLITPYEKMLNAMAHDKVWKKEIAFGQRIGFYRFKGEIGNGNFSQVKIATHSLTQG